MITNEEMKFHKTEQLVQFEWFDCGGIGGHLLRTGSRKGVRRSELM